MTDIVSRPRRFPSVGGEGENLPPLSTDSQLCLIEAMETGKYAAAYLVIGGEGWKKSLKEFYLRRGLDKWIQGSDKVQIISL